MNTIDRPPGGKAPQDDIEVWVDGLRGRRADPETETLRRLLQEKESTSAQPSGEYAWQRLRFRLKREGLLASSGRKLSSRFYALAAGLFVLAMTLHFLAPFFQGPDWGEQEATRMRGGEALPTFAVHAPAALAGEITSGLAALNIPARSLRQADASWLVEARVPEKAWPQVQELLARLRLPAVAMPPNGQFRLILKPEQR